MRTLVVDDELVSRKKMAKILNHFGPCDSVKNGKAAISVVKTAVEENNQYDLITLDISMPEISGTQVLTAIREIEEEHELRTEKKAKILMVTSHSDIETVKACAGKCNGYVVKPFNKDLMVEKLTKINLL
ncbi:MAG: response regulator [Pseudomonadota bacterium]